MRYLIPLVLLSLALSGGCSKASKSAEVLEKHGGETISSFGTVSGSVVEAGSAIPIPFADVVLAGTGIRLYADTRGVFTLGRIPPGTYTVRVRMTGYLWTEKGEVHVQPGRTTFLRIELWPLYDYPRPPEEGPEPGHVIETKPRQRD